MQEIFKGLSTTEKIRLLLATKDVSKKELGTLLGVTDETIRNWMRKDEWDLNDLKKIAAEYCVELIDLI